MWAGERILLISNRVWDDVFWRPSSHNYNWRNVFYLCLSVYSVKFVLWGSWCLAKHIPLCWSRLLCVSRRRLWGPWCTSNQNKMAEFTLGMCLWCQGAVDSNDPVASKHGLQHLMTSTSLPVAFGHTAIADIIRGGLMFVNKECQ